MPTKPAKRAYTDSNGQPLFNEITTGAWRASTPGAASLNHNLYGLGRDGRVYVLRSGKGWVEVVEDQNSRGVGPDGGRQSHIGDEGDPF